jgi:serine/threonine protein kinase
MICTNCQTVNDGENQFCRECGATLMSAGLTTPFENHDRMKGESVVASQVSQKDEMAGHCIDGRYRLEARIGLGGMGTVYRATRLLIGDEVAIKILHQDRPASDPQAVERFRREAQAAARLKHPNAVSIYDFGVSSDGLQYLAMELIEGKNLRQMISEQGSLTPEMTAEIITQVCAALGEAHQQGIVHRDIKPDNIIVHSSSQGLRVKVLDFGIAKLRDQVASHLTQTGSVVGTPHYMSPEQCIGEELDGRADIYSLGIVLYEMLCGVVPFNAPISTAVVIQHVNQPPPSVCERNSTITPAVEAVVFHALAKRREDRPQTAYTLAQELNAAVNGTGDLSSLLNRAASLNAFMPGATSGTAATANVPTMHMSQRPSLSEPEQHSKSRLKTFSLVAFILLAVSGGLAFWRWPGKKTQETLAANVETKSEKPAPVEFDKIFRGSVGNNFIVEMRLKRNGTELSGSYFFKHDGDVMQHGNPSDDRMPVWGKKDISQAMLDSSIKGKVDEQENFWLDEFDSSGKKAGSFKGRFLSTTAVEGDWTDPNGKNARPFAFKETSEQTSAGFTLSSKKIKRKNTQVEIEANYPQIEGLQDTSIQDNFNNKVKALVTKNISETKEGSHSVGFTIEHRSDHLLSVVFGAGIEWPGAAHGMQYNYSFMYDLRNNREVKLEDLFNAGVNHLRLLSGLCARDVMRQKKKNGFDEIFEDSEAAAYDALKEDSTFYPAQAGLVIIFDPYQVGSYAEGFYVVTIPYSALEGAINPNGPLAAFIK